MALVNPDPAPFAFPPDHDERVRQAEARAEWELGDRSWAAVILHAYFDPTNDAWSLEQDQES
jgi:hypothetical protein